MHNSIRWLSESPANRVFHSVAGLRGRDPRISTSLLAFGTIATLGFLYAFNNKRSSIEISAAHLNQAGISTSENREALLAHREESWTLALAIWD